MTRSRRKKGLYEVIGKSSFKPSYNKTLEQLCPKESGKESAAEGPTAQVPQIVPGWPKRPRIVQFNAGRIEISIPYQLGIAVLLGVVLLVLVVFRLGQNLSVQKPADSAAEVPKGVQEVTERPTAGTSQRPDAVRKVPLNAKKVEPAKPTLKGNNRIVITQYQTRRELSPVQRHFAANGIETEIERRGGGFFLVTKETYDNPERAGTSGSIAKKKIIEVGAKYKAPKGYESFAPNLFRDAYGEKIR